MVLPQRQLVYERIERRDRLPSLLVEPVGTHMVKDDIHTARRLDDFRTFLPAVAEPSPQFKHGFKANS